MPKQLKKASKSQDKAAKWLIRVPKSDSTPLDVATETTAEVVWATGNLFHFVSLEDISESLQTIVAAMYTSAGVEYPDPDDPDVDVYLELPEAPTEEQVKNAYRVLSWADDVQEFEWLAQNLRRAIDVANEWYVLRYPDK